MVTNLSTQQSVAFDFMHRFAPRFLDDCTGKTVSETSKASTIETKDMVDF